MFVRCGVTKPPFLFAGGQISPLWQVVMTIGSGRRYRCFSAVNFPTRMTRHSPKKSNRSKGAFFELPPELKSQRRQIAAFLDANVCKPPVLEPGCNSQITRVHPALMKEMLRREREFFRRRRAKQQ